MPKSRFRKFVNLPNKVGQPSRLSTYFHFSGQARRLSYHSDTFDRMIIAQSQLEELPILTSDPQIAKYKVKVIWK